MKVKASWAVFVPLYVGAVFLHIYHIFFLGSDEITQKLFGNYSLLINTKTEPEMIVILAAALFVLVGFFSMIDRKTSSYCDIKSDPIAGIFLVMSGLLLGVESAVSLLALANGTEVTATSLATNVLGLIVALLFAIVGMGLLVGFNIAKKMRILMIIPTVWAAWGMINSFIAHRKEASSFAFFDVLAWVFLTAFLFQNSMVLCGIEIKNPVKSSFVYGLPFILFSSVYFISEVENSIYTLGYFEFTQLVPQFLFAALGLYTTFSLFRLSSKMITKAKAQELYGSVPEEDVKKSKDKEEVKTEDEPESAFGVGSTKYVTAEFEKIRLEKAAKKAMERTGKVPAVSVDGDEDEPDEEPLSTLDKMDKLIMELSDDANKN